MLELRINKRVLLSGVSIACDMLPLAQKALVIDEQNRILILRSRDPDGDGNSWDFPGGRMEQGEAPLETLQRELQEEIGWSGDVQSATLFHVGWYKGFGDRMHEDVYKTFWILRVPSFTPTLSWEHSQSTWYDLHQLPEDFNGPYRDIVNSCPHSLT